MNTVPVALGDLYEGFASAHGLIRDEGDHLCIEFQVQDAVFGLIKSGIRQVRIPVADLASVTLERRWFGLMTKLIIQVSSMEAVREIPGMAKGQCTLGIARKDRMAAAKFVDDLHRPDRAS